MEPVVSVILVGAILALFVIVIMGNIYLTQFAFTSSTSGNTRSLDLKDWQVGMARTAQVLFWISLTGTVLYETYKLGTQQKYESLLYR